MEPLPIETVTAAIGDGVGKLVERTIGSNTPDVSSAMKSFRDAYRENLHDNTTLYAGVPEGLARMHGEGIQLAICSNKPKALCERILRHFEVDALFFEICGGDSFTYRKPDPRPIHHILEEGNAGAPAAWMVGDHVTDLKAARHVGVRSIFVTYGFGHCDGEIPTRIAHDFTGAANIVLSDLSTRDS